MKRSRRKLKTHRSLLAASIRLVGINGSFSATSLREVTRVAGIVPAAFYRHFSSMDELGVKLVDYSFRSLKRLLNELRQKPQRDSRILITTVDAYLHYVRTHRKFFIFLVRERSGGLLSVRTAIRDQLTDISKEIAEDITKSSQLSHLSESDAQTIASLLVDTMISATDVVLDLPLGQLEPEQKLIKETNKKLQIILLGARALRVANLESIKY